MLFEELNVNSLLKEKIKALGLVELTAIQEKCIPEVLNGTDVVGQSGTGSGKTIAFGLPIIDKIGPKGNIQSLILTPTRELCVQVSQVLHDLGRGMHVKVVSIYGGVSIGPQKDDLRTADIVVGTPGRILDHINQRTINLSKIRFLVLDEADKMAEMGFIEDIEKIIGFTPKSRQTMLFSATMMPSVEVLKRNHMIDPVVMKATLFVDKSLLKQIFYAVHTNDKFSLLVHLLKKQTNGLALIFCATRTEVDIVARNLKQNGINATAIHGGLAQNKRLKAINALRDGELDVLVATDVAARGLDIKNVTYVYNYDVPKTEEDYIHRIGRTARAGEFGCAVTLLAERDHDNFRRFSDRSNLNLQQFNLPDFERVRFQRHTSDERRGGPMRRGPRQSSHYGGRGPEHEGSRSGERSHRPHQDFRSSREFGVKADRPGRARHSRESSGSGFPYY